MFIVKVYTPNFHEIDGGGFQAKITMNPCDRMVFAEITALPRDADEAETKINEFRDFLCEDYGGKSIISLPKGHVLPLNVSITPVKNLQFLELTSDMFKGTIANKTKVEGQLGKFHPGGYSLLSSKENYQDRYDELSAFKIQNAPFITKKKQEFYSSQAEYAKVNNEFVRHFAVVDEKHKIIATVMIAIHGDMAYVSDFIVGQDVRNQGLSQAMMVKVFETLGEEFPHVHRVWYIAGGDGETAIGQHLRTDVFCSTDFDVSKQIAQGSLVVFTDPGPQLLKAIESALNPQTEDTSIPGFSAVPGKN